MVPVREYLRGVEWIAVTWLASVVLVALLTRFALRRWRWRAIGRLFRREDGAAYSLAYVLTFPLYVYLVCLVIESSLLLLTKVGTVYAAYAAARSGIVYRPQPVPGRAEERARLAAVHAMVPFASSSDIHADGVRRGQAGAANGYAREAGKVLRLSPAPSADYLTAKYLYADKAVRVVLVKDDPKPGALLRVELIYQAPSYVPGIGRLFGTRSPNGGPYYVVPIVTKLSLPEETPRSTNGQLGIHHESP